MHAFRSPAISSPSRLFFWSLASLLLLLAWDASGLDLTLARWFGSASGFALENHWFWRGVLHDDMRPLPWLFEGALLIGIARPVGTLRRLPVSPRPAGLNHAGGAAGGFQHQAAQPQPQPQPQPQQLPLEPAGIRRCGQPCLALGLGRAGRRGRWLLSGRSCLGGFCICRRLFLPSGMSCRPRLASGCWATAAGLDLGVTWFTRQASQRPARAQAEAPGVDRQKSLTQPPL